MDRLSSQQGFQQNFRADEDKRDEKPLSGLEKLDLEESYSRLSTNIERLKESPDSFVKDLDPVAAHKELVGKILSNIGTIFAQKDAILTKAQRILPKEDFESFAKEYESTNAKLQTVKEHVEQTENLDPKSKKALFSPFSKHIEVIKSNYEPFAGMVGKDEISTVVSKWSRKIDAVWQRKETEAFKEIVRNDKLFRGNTNDEGIEKELSKSPVGAYLIRETAKGEFFVSIVGDNKRILHVPLSLRGEHQSYSLGSSFHFSPDLKDLVTKYIKIDSLPFYITKSGEDLESFKINEDEKIYFLEQFQWSLSSEPAFELSVRGTETKTYLLTYTDNKFSLNPKVSEELGLEKGIKFDSILDFIRVLETKDPDKEPFRPLVDMNRLKRSPYNHGSISGTDASQLTSTVGDTVFRSKTTASDGYPAGTPVLTSKLPNRPAHTIEDERLHKMDMHVNFIPCKNSETALANQTKEKV